MLAYCQMGQLLQVLVVPLQKNTDKRLLMPSDKSVPPSSPHRRQTKSENQTQPNPTGGVDSEGRDLLRHRTVRTYHGIVGPTITRGGNSSIFDFGQ